MASETSTIKRPRLAEIDRATAIAIFLVVVGHIVAREPPADNQWYVLLKFYIYKFHMPFFMMLSGVVFYHTFKPLVNWAQYGTWAQKKIFRLAPGFFLFGAVIIFGKVGASYFLHVDNLQTNFIASLWHLLVIPIESPGGSLWYIYVLLEFYLLAPLILWATKCNLTIILAFSFCIHVIGALYTLPKYFMLDGICEYLFYFTLGMILQGHYQVIIKKIYQFRYAFLVLFILSFLSVKILPHNFSKLVIGLASLPSILAFTVNIPKFFDNLLLKISTYTYTIYLMNTLTIGFTKGVMLKVFPWDGTNFFVFFPVLLLAGLLGPIIAHHLIISRIPLISKITR